MTKVEVEINTKLIEGKQILKDVINCIENTRLEEAATKLAEAQNIFKGINSNENLSICMSIFALIQYLQDNKKLQNSLQLIEDAKYLAEVTKDTNAKLFNELCIASINHNENNFDIAFRHYDNAKDYGIISNEYEILGHIVTRMKQIKNNQKFSLPIQNDPLISLVKIGRSITAQTDINVLLRVIAEETKNAIQADRCTVFLYDKKSNELWSKVALGLGSQEIRFPADKGLAGYVVRTGESINITDAYNDDRFNPDVDKETGYKTNNMLCMPIKNNNQEIIGAFQVLNKNRGVFTKNDEDLLVAIGGSASIALENAQLFEQQKELYKEQKLLFESFINTLAASIDARDKITAGHSTRVKLYSMLMVDELKLDNKTKEIIEKAATLHDIGKIGIRDSVLQKEGKLTDEEYKHIQEHVQITHNILQQICTNEDFKQISEIACSHHEKYDGSGYYRRLKGEEIPYGGRILAVSDVFDAITSKRHYRDKMPIVNVIDILLKGSGTHFDKSLVDLFLKIPTNKIINVFLTESHIAFKSEDKNSLSKLNLLDIYNLSIKEDKLEDEKNILSLFNYYYEGKQE